MLLRAKAVPLLLFLSLALSSQAAGTEPEGESLADQLAAKLKAMECPGALVGVFPDSGKPERYALGVADIDSHAPMTFDMHLRIGSVTKPFLAVVVLHLCDEGKLSLDDPISKYVADVPAGDRITLRMLGANTSGLFNSIENKDYQRAIMKEPARQWTPAEILKYSAGGKPYNAPGEKWRYSNTNAVLLAMCVQKVAGTNWQDQIALRVCRPLGLEHTAAPRVAELPNPHSAAYRNGYPDKVIGYGDVFYNVSNYSAAWTGAAGNMYSILDDLGKAAKPLAIGALLGPIGKQAIADWIPTGREDIQYSFFMYRRGEGIGHTGDVPGFNAWMFYYPRFQGSVIALTNLSNNKDGTMPADELAKLVVADLAKRGK
jgi:D-alanyl-D-alanine carboxypeptidase